MYKYFLAPILLAAYVAAGPTILTEQSSRSLDCEDYDLTCYFVKAASYLDRATLSKNIEIFGGVNFVRDTPISRTERKMQKSEADIMNELPHDTSDRMLRAFNIMSGSFVSFVRSHNLKLNLSEESISRSLTEGRAKMKKIILPLIAAVGFKVFMLVPILFIGLALLAVKALVFGKIALLVAGILGFQKLFGGNSGGVGIWNKNPSGWGTGYDNSVSAGWAANGAYPQPQLASYSRSFETANTKVDAQNLAYPAHVPNAS